jgi:hypothetical protein
VSLPATNHIRKAAAHDSTILLETRSKIALGSGHTRLLAYVDYFVTGKVFIVHPDIFVKIPLNCIIVN